MVGDFLFYTIVRKLGKRIALEAIDFVDSTSTFGTTPSVMKLEVHARLKILWAVMSVQVRCLSEGQLVDTAVWQQTRLESVGEVILQVSIYFIYRNWKLKY